MGLHGREDQSTNTTCLFASKNTVTPRLPSKIPAKVAEPFADAIYNAYPDQRPGFYRYVERHIRRRN